MEFHITYVTKTPTIFVHYHPILPHSYYKSTHRHSHLHQLFLKLFFFLAFCFEDVGFLLPSSSDNKSSGDKIIFTAMTGIWSSGDCLSIEILFSKYPKCHTIQSADTRVELGGKHKNWISFSSQYWRTFLKNKILKNVTPNYHQLKQLDQPSCSLTTQIVWRTTFQTILYQTICFLHKNTPYQWAHHDTTLYKYFQPYTLS